MRKSVHPSRIEGVLDAPPSKSVMLRLTAAALLAEGGMTRIRNPSRCEDARAGLRVAAALGASVSDSPLEIAISGGLRPRRRVLDCGESGLSLRMFAAVAALSAEEVELTGGPALLRRPAGPVETTLRDLGAEGRTRDGYPPVVVRGPLRGGEAAVDGSGSSQFLTGLLLALPLAERDSILNVRGLVSRPYVDLTLQILELCGLRIGREGYGRFSIPAGQRFAAGNFRVEGDWSAAAFLFVLGAAGGKIRVKGLDMSSLQPDRVVLDVLEEAGARIVRGADGAEVERGPLRAFRFDASDAPDLVPPLAALACHCEGTSVLKGAGRLKFKESDRAAALAEELGALGARVALAGGVLEITGGPLRGGIGRTRGDHRVAMALAAAAVAARAPVTIEGAEHAAKSYPRFFEDLASAGGKIDE